MFPVPHKVTHARETDLGELFTLTRGAFVKEAQRYRDPFVPPLSETPEDLHALLEDPQNLVLTAVASQDGEWGRRGRIIGALRLSRHAQEMVLGRLVVAPDLQGCGIGSSLLEAALEEAGRRPGITHLTLYAGAVSGDTLAIYRRFRFVEVAGDVDERGRRLVVMTRKV